MTEAGLSAAIMPVLLFPHRQSLISQVRLESRNGGVMTPLPLVFPLALPRAWMHCPSVDRDLLMFTGKEGGGG